MIGATVSHYRVLEKLGTGGMGEVYLAEDLTLGRRVALKFLTAADPGDRLSTERFLREARTASALNHPHICTIHEIGDHAGRPFLVLEWLEGRTLKDEIAEKPLAIDKVVDLGIQIADALEAAHSIGVIHRDVKPANIFVTRRGQAKVLDFGLAKGGVPRRVDAEDANASTAIVDDNATGFGLTLGTVAYMSPEQARAEELDARSDLFSFGLVLYEMVTGRAAFGGQSTAVIFDALLNREPAPAVRFNATIPAELERIINKALEKDRNLRYGSAAEIRADLMRLKRETDSGRLAAASQATTAAVLPAREGPLTRVRWPIWIAAAAVAVLAAVGGYLSLRSPGDQIDSMAVLPFVNSSGSSDTEYLTDGLTESLINSLSQLPGLRVSARSVVFRYKGGDADPLQVGKDLDVRAVITGRIATRGNTLIVQADLVDVTNGSQLWGGQYNRPMADILAIQDEIAGEIFDKLRLRITGEQLKRATKRYTDNAEAYQLYLRGRYYWNQGTIGGYKRAIEYFQQAVDTDPGYALAHAGLADSYLFLGSYWVEATPEAKVAALKALELDPDLAEAHVALGHIKLWLDWDWAAAAREFTKGIELNPSSALAHNQYAMYLAAMGRFNDAIAEVTRAEQLDPLSPIVNTDLGWCLIYAGRGSEAVEQFRKTLELDANYLAARWGLGAAYLQQQRYREAIDELRRAVTLSEGSPVPMGYLGLALARNGEGPAARKLLDELKSLADRQYVPATAVALVHAGLGEEAATLDWLERAYQEHDFAMAFLGVAPWFDGVRSDPRFEALLGRLQLPPRPGANR